MKGRAARPGRRARWGLFLVAAELLMRGTPVGADEYRDFRIPAHDQIHWNANFSTSGWRASSDVTSFSQSTNRHSANVNGWVRSRFSWLTDSDPVLTSLSAGADLAGTRAWDSQNSLRDQSPLEVLRFEDSRVIRTLMERWMLSATHRRYPWGVPLGFEVFVGGVGDYSQRWIRQGSWSSTTFNNQTTTTRLTDAAWNYRHTLSASLMLGLGRVRDATGVYEAEVIEQRLLDAGALTRRLSPEARQRLARLLTLRYSVVTIRERPGRTLWQTLEQILRDDGALSERGLDGYAVLRAGEPLAGAGIIVQGLPVSPVTRWRGWFVGPLLFDQHGQDVIRGHNSQFRQDVINGTVQPPQELSLGYRQEFHFDRVQGGIRAEGHRPLGSRWQVDGVTQALVPLRSEEDGLQLFSSGIVNYVIADRWLASAGLAHSRRVQQRTMGGIEYTDDDSWSVSGFARADYYLEDQFGLGIGITGAQDHLRRFGEEATFRAVQVNLGLTYRFIGRYHAPGLLGPIDVMSDR